MKSLFLSLFALVLLSGCRSAAELSSSEEEAFQTYAFNLMTANINTGKIAAKKTALERSATTTYTTQRNTPGKGAVIYVSDDDLAYLKKNLPTCGEVRWTNFEKRRGDVPVEWKTPAGTVYTMNFSGTLDKPQSCAYTFATPPLFESKNADVFDEPVPEAKGEYRFGELGGGAANTSTPK